MVECMVAIQVAKDDRFGSGCQNSSGHKLSKGPLLLLLLLLLLLVGSAMVDETNEVISNVYTPFRST